MTGNTLYWQIFSKKINKNNTNIHLFNVLHNTNYNIHNKFQQTPGQHVYCFDWKMTLRPFTFNTSTILSHADYGALVKLEIIYTGEVP